VSDTSFGIILMVSFRSSNCRKVYGADVIILEGILAFFNKELRDIYDVKVFVDTEDDIRLARRCISLSFFVSLFLWVVLVRRDICERGRNIDSVLDQYMKFVKPSFDAYILPVRVQQFFPPLKHI